MSFGKDFILGSYQVIILLYEMVFETVNVLN